MTLDARAATSQVKITTARPAVTDVFAFTVIMQGKAGLPASFGLFAGSQPDFWVSPANIKSTVGRLRTFTQVGLASKPGPGVLGDRG